MNDVQQPLFSLIIPVFNVAKYLPAFLKSIESQDYLGESFELIFVDDGSTDQSKAMIDEWVEKRSSVFAVKVLTKSNGGLSSARNFGLANANGYWVSFPDPDDRFSNRFFCTIIPYLRDAKVDDIAAIFFKMVNYFEASGRFEDHPKRSGVFANGTRAVNLEIEINNFQGAVNSQFLKRDILLSLDRPTDSYGPFDSRVKPAGEDIETVARYFLAAPRKRAMAVVGPEYLHTIRFDGTSLIQSARTDSAHYSDQVRFGCLELCRFACSFTRKKYPPKWLQIEVLYQLWWFFKNDYSSPETFKSLPTCIQDEFQRMLSEIFTFIEPSTISVFSTPRLTMDLRAAFSASTGRMVTTYVVADKVDLHRKLARFDYYSSTPQPSIILRRGELKAWIPFRKIRPIVYFGKQFAYQIIEWTPSWGSLTAYDSSGVALPIINYDQRAIFDRPNMYLNQSQLMLLGGAGEQPQRWRELLPKLKWPSLQEVKQKIEFLIDSRLRAKYFKNAWLIMDRNTTARDNGESYYRYLQKERPDINSFFVVSRNSSDYQRLKREGFRIIPYGSSAHRSALRNALHLISSQADEYVVRPTFNGKRVNATWQFTFLQHGVIQNDMSRWLNNKRIDTFVTTTEDECNSIISNDSNYTFSAKEVVVTGLPRHDRLAALVKNASDSGRRYILVAPTWRKPLVNVTTDRSSRSLKDSFYTSDYYREWSEVLSSKQLKDLAVKYGLELAFIPHPEMENVGGSFETDPDVRIFSYDNDDFQELLSQTKIFITDYTSSAFDAAFAGCGIVYFRFDAEEFFNGDHVCVRGYFDANNDGFGPVVSSVSGVIEAVSRALSDADQRPEEGAYQSRIVRARKMVDGKACQRITEQIESRSVPPWHAW